MKTNLLVAMLLICLGSFAQESGNAGSYGRNNSGADDFDAATFRNDSTVELHVKTLMNVQPDYYIVMFSLTQQCEKIGDCNNDMNKRINLFLDSCTKINIKKEDCFIDFISQVPEYEINVEKKAFSKSLIEIPKGFELKKNVHLKIKDNTLLYKILIYASQQDIYDLIKVEYVIENQTKIIDSLRSVSMTYLNKKLKDFTNAGFRTNGIKYQVVSEEINSSQPADNYASYTAYTNSNNYAYRSGSIKSYNYQQKSTTYYYNHQSYSDFDIVINSGTLKPAIQYYYSIAVRYSLKKQ